MKRLSFQRISLLFGVLYVLLTALWPAVAVADAPGLRGPETAPAGRVGDLSWAEIEPLPPIAGVLEPPTLDAATVRRGATALMPGATIYGQTEDQANGIIGFAMRSLNPGNWVLDAGLGIVSAAMQSIQQTLLGFVLEVTGTEPPTEQTEAQLGCGSPLSLLFCTQPQDLLPAPYAEPETGPRSQEVAAQGTTAGILRTVWYVLQPAAIAILTLVFTVRLGRVMYAGPAAYQAEAKALVLPFFAACALVGATPALLRVLLSFFAALNNSILNSAVFKAGAINIPFFTYLPLDVAQSLALGPAHSLVALYVVLFIAFVVAWIRLAKLVLLLALAPLAGATLIDRSTSHLFGNWLSKVLELLMHQLGWTIAALVGSAILNTLVGAPLESDSDTFIGRTIGTTLILVFMLCQQQLFSGLFAIAGGTSPVMGGAIGHVATGLGMASGLHGMLKKDQPVRLEQSRSLTLVRAKNVLLGRGWPPDGGPPGGGAAAGNGRSPGGGGAAGNARPAGGGAAPGARARSAANRTGNPSSRPPRPAGPAPAVPNTSPQVAALPAAPPAYIAAVRARRDPAAQPTAPAAASLLLDPARERRLGRLRAQASVTGRQVWRAAPGALIRDAGTGIHRASSYNGQQALRKLKPRPRSKDRS